MSAIKDFLFVLCFAATVMSAVAALVAWNERKREVCEAHAGYIWVPRVWSCLQGIRP